MDAAIFVNFFIMEPTVGTKVEILYSRASESPTA
jgi:hypothetical protein